MHTSNKARYQKPIDNLSFWYDPQYGERYFLKANVPKDRLHKCEYWDSVLEFKVYNELLNLFPQKEIERQHCINILPAKHPFKKWSWDIDFKVTHGNSTLYIEAKGKWLLDNLSKEGFAKTLRMIEMMYPDIWNNLHIVGSDYSGSWLIPGTLIKVKPISEFKEFVCLNQLTQIK